MNLIVRPRIYGIPVDNNVQKGISKCNSQSSFPCCIHFYFHTFVTAVTELLFYLISVKTYNSDAYSGFAKFNVTTKIRWGNLVIFYLKTIFMYNGRYFCGTVHF